MRRDMDLVREILIEIGGKIDSIELDPLNPEDELYEYHIDILKQADLIYYQNKFQDMVPKVYIDEPRLTWKGNNFLDDISDESIWKKTKDVIASNGLELGSVPISILKDLAKNFIKSKVGLGD